MHGHAWHSRFSSISFRREKKYAEIQFSEKENDTKDDEEEEGKKRTMQNCCKYSGRISYKLQKWIAIAVTQPSHQLIVFVFLNKFYNFYKSEFQPISRDRRSISDEKLYNS